MKVVILGLIRTYQKIVSPCIMPCCRFYPSCSIYAIHAIEKKGLRRGLWLALKRLLKCHPGNPGGYDPV